MSVENGRGGKTMDKFSKKDLKRIGDKATSASNHKAFESIPRYGYFRRKLGVQKVFRHDEFQELPDILSNLPSYQLSDLFVEYTSWLTYASQRLFEHSWERKRTKAEYFTLKAQKLFLASGRYKDKEKASVMRDPEIIDLRKMLLEQEAYISNLKSLIWRIRNYLDAIRFERDRRRDERFNEGQA